MHTADLTTLVIAEDHHVVRHGLRLLLEGERDLRIIGEASDGWQAVELVRTLAPDLLLLDLIVPRLHGLEVTRQVARDYPRTRVVILSGHAEESYVVEALQNGAAAYVLKDSTATDLVEAVRKVKQGRRYLSPSLSEKAISLFEQQAKAPGADIYDSLTSRERLVLQMAAEGSSSAEIGKQLFISQRTAETHRANLMRKLGLHSQTDLVRFAIRKRIIPH